MPQDPGPLRVDPVDDRTVLVRPGELDCESTPFVRERLLILLNQGHATVVLDLSDRTVCACCAIPALVRTHRRAGMLGVSLRLVLPDDPRTRGAVREAWLHAPEPLELLVSTPTTG